MQGAIDMKKVLAVVFMVSMATIWTGGCQEEQVSSDVKQSRLRAAENGDLKVQLQVEKKKRDDEIINLKAEAKKRDDEIINLKAEAKRRDDEIKNLKFQIQAEIDKRDNEVKDIVSQCQTEMNQRDAVIQLTRKQLGECAQTRDEKLQEEADKQCKESISAMNDWNSELKDEVERLKAELAKIKGEEKK